MIHYFECTSDHDAFELMLDLEAPLLVWLREQITLRCPGETVLLELRSETKTGIKQRYWKFVWDLSSFEHEYNASNQWEVQTSLLPWYLCVECKPNKYALYKMDDGADESEPDDEQRRDRRYRAEC